jgi:hypothetical protein
MVAQQATDDGADDETEPEGRADQTEALRALLLRCDVRDIGRCGRDCRAGNACNRMADEQHGH